MNFQQKAESLRQKIEDALLPLIDNDYVLWECPYYDNIGDILIWEGELQFLKKVRYKCLGYASRVTCCFPDLPSGTVILLQGGGNFGDLWRSAQEFRLKVCRKYTTHKIIFFPQTVYYENPYNLLEDVRILSAHPNLTICVRDEKSYRLMREHLGNLVLLLPDMAFCISSWQLDKLCCAEEDKGLFLKRRDKEWNPISYCFPEDMKCDISDWPVYEKKTLHQYFLNALIRLNICFGLPLIKTCTNWWAYHIYRKFLVREGVRFLSKYKVVYTTRLHVLILGILLNKRCIVMDNVYGKNSSFYNTWLEDLEGVTYKEQ